MTTYRLIRKTFSENDQERLLDKKDYAKAAGRVALGATAGLGVGHLLKKGLDKISSKDLALGTAAGANSAKLQSAHLANLKGSSKLRNGLAIAGTVGGLAWAAKKLKDKKKQPSSGMLTLLSLAPLALYIKE